MSKVYYNCSYKPLIPPHLSTQKHDMCHSTIDSHMIKIKPQPNRQWVNQTFDNVGAQFDPAKTNHAMTHVLVLSVETRRNERSKRVVMTL
jgi:hypothetical protein